MISGCIDGDLISANGDQELDAAEPVPATTQAQDSDDSALAREPQEIAAASLTVGAGSFIIPMDTAARGQDAGMLRAYGLVYQLLRHNVPVHWVIRSGKAAGGLDFTMPMANTTVDVETDVVLGAARVYSGGPFIISHQNRAAAQPIIDAWLADDDVTVVHDLTSGSLTIDSARILVHAPRIGVLQDGNEGLGFAELNAAGIPDSTGATWAAGSIDLLSENEIIGASTTNDRDGALFNADATVRYCHLLAMHYAPTASTGEVVQEVRSWLAAGPLTHAYMQCLSAQTIENHASGRFLTTLGIVDDGATPTSLISRYPSEPFSQIFGAFTPAFGTVDSIGLASGSAFKTRARTLFNQGTSLLSRISLMTGYLDGSLENGRVTYFGGHEYLATTPVSANPQSNGVRLALNALFEAGCATAAIQPDVIVTKTGPATTDASEIVYTISYSNPGPRPAEHVVLRDVLPVGASFVSATDGGIPANGEVSWDLGTLGSGVSGSRQVTVAVTADGEYDSVAIVSFAHVAVKNVTSAVMTTVRDAPPAVTITAGPSGQTNDNTPTFEFVSDDPAADFACRFRSTQAFVACTSPFTPATALADGAYTFEVQASDASAQLGTSATRAFTVATGAPVVTITGGPAGATADPTPTYTFSVAAVNFPPATVECRVSATAAFQPCVSPFTVVPPLDEGEYEFQVRVTDSRSAAITGAVDQVSLATQPFAVDTIRPVIDNLTGPSDPIPTNLTMPAFTFTLSEGGTPVTALCRIDAGPATDCTAGAYAVAAPLNGAHSFHVVATDEAGNEATASRLFTVDIDPPTVTITGGPEGPTSDWTPTFTFFTGGSPETIDCRVDGVPTTDAAFAPCSSGTFTTELNPGAFVFEVRVTDLAGNSATASRGFEVDTDAPTVQIQTGPQGATSDDTPSFTFTTTGEPTTTMCRVDTVPPAAPAAPFVTCDDGYTAAALTDGDYVFEVRVTDSAANAFTAQRFFTVDTAGPDTVLAGLPRNPTNQPGFRFTFTSNDPAATFRCALDNAVREPCAGVYEANFVDDGEHVFSVEAVDGAGTADPSPAEYAWVVDTVAPNTTLTAVESDNTFDATGDFEFAANEDAEFECRVDDNDFLPCESPYHTLQLADGLHTFQVRAVDTAGNVDETSANHVWEVNAGCAECDLDGDGIENAADNCPTVANPEQEDSDDDALGDACDCDDNDDGFCDEVGTGGGSCGCRSNGAGAGGELVLIAIVGLVIGRRRGRRRFPAWVAAALAGWGSLWAAGPARAQSSEDKDYPIERMRFALDRDGILDVEWGGVGSHLSWDLALWMGHADDPLVVSDGGERVGELVDGRVGGSLSAAISLFGKVKLGVELPIVALQDRNENLSGAAVPLDELSTTLFGDVRISPKVLLQRGGPGRFGVALTPSFTLPTSERDNYAGQDHVTFAPELAVSREFGALRLAGNLGYLARKRTSGVNLEVNDEIFSRLGASYGFAESHKKPISVDLSVSSATAANAMYGSSSRSPVEIHTAVNYDLNEVVRVMAGAGVGLSGGYGTPDWRAFGGVRFTYSRDDLDLDGIKVLADRCPQVAEDRDGFEDSDGCPDLDDDRDRIADAADQCPREAEVWNAFFDEDGCPDALPAITLRGTAWYGGPLVGANVTAYQLVDGQRAQVLGNAMTVAGGAFVIELAGASGSVELEVTGGGFIESTGGMVHLGVGDVLRGIALDLQPAEQRIDVAITPWTDLTLALANARLARGKEITHEAALAKARELVRAHLGFDPTHTAIASLSRKSKAVTDAVKHALSLAGLAQLAATAASDQRASVKQVNTAALLSVLRRDASSPEALFDGNGAEALFVGASCAPPPGCSADGVGCYSSCAVHTSTLRSRLGAAVLGFVGSGANGSGIGRDHLVAWIAAMWNNADPELFGGESVEALDRDGPMLSWPTPAEAVVVADTLPISVTAADLVGVKDIKVTVEGAAPLKLEDGAPAAEQFTSILSTSKLAEGVHTLAVTAVDRLLNPTTASRAFVVDRTAPAITVHGVTADGYHDNSATVVYTATDPHLRAVSATLDGEPFLSETGITAEGPHTLVVTASDRAGNLATLTVPFTVDATPPAVAVNGVEEGASYQKAPLVTFEASDTNLSGVVASLDGKAYKSGDAITGEGIHNLVVTATDRAGATTSVARSFRVDNTAPMILTWVNSILTSAGPLAATVAEVLTGDHPSPPVLVTGVNDGGMYQTARVIRFAGNDPQFTKTTATLNGAAFNSGDSVDAEGAHTLAVTAVDAAGAATNVTRTFTIDKTPPVLTLSGVSADAYVKETTVIDFAAADPSLHKVAALLDGIEVSSGTKISAEGSHTLIVAAVDRAGNAAMKTVPFTIDKTPPTVTISGVADDGAYQNPPVIGFEGRDLNLSNVVATVDGAAIAWGGKVAGDGPHTLVVTATDLAGHTSTLSRKFVIDRTAPTITTAGVAADAHVRQPPALTFEAADPILRAVAATLDGAPFTSGSTVSVDGSHRLVVTASDRAGNTAVTVVPFVLDTTPPAISIGGITDGATYEAAPAITFEARDLHLVSLNATLDGSPFTSGVTPAGEGVHTLVVTATDRAGSTSTLTHTFTIAAKVVVVVPKVPPVITLTGVTAGGVHPSPSTITFEAFDTDLRTVEATLDGAPFKTGGEVTSEGSHTLIVTATDGAANVTTVTVPFVIDGSAPVVTVRGLTEQDTYDAPPVVTFEATDLSLVSIEATLDDKPFASGSAIEAGSHTLVITAVDKLGHKTVTKRVLKVEAKAGPTAKAENDADAGGGARVAGDDGNK